MDQGDGKLAYGIYIQNGRLKGDLKKALRRVIERYELPVRLTANQNIILCDIEESWKGDIISTLSGAGIKWAPAASCAAQLLVIGFEQGACNACASENFGWLAQHVSLLLAAAGVLLLCQMEISHALSINLDHCCLIIDASGPPSLPIDLGCGLHAGVAAVYQA